ncbi:MAG: L,D-transpeptidase family protein [Firmicutes bacterium]|jgi:peptidoglycan hydrolase-like protein with peptidoglycan-binding domain|nr:L,D-transpeptidase family protein [Bacillota bacterium]MDH7495194.1 L,D-transpeptidase family protein [Bacillota bacterium]
MAMVAKRPVKFKRGDSGPFIAEAQEMLARLGFDPGLPEGVFVSKTEDAVRAFQREYGLEVTGVLDCATLKLLYEEVDPQGYPSVLMEGPVDVEVDGGGGGGGGGDGGDGGVGGGGGGGGCGEGDGGGEGGGSEFPEGSGREGLVRHARDGLGAESDASNRGRAIVISVGERALGLYEGDRLVRRYPVAIGKPSTPTPVGTHRILEKIMYPGGGLGTRWMGFTHQMHGIHGTNRPELIGQAVSNGCVRMHNRDVEELYGLVDIGTPVIVITGPVSSWPSLGKAGGVAGSPSSVDGQSGKPWGLGTPGSDRPRDPEEPGSRTYVVQPGDSLWSIAKRFGTTVEALVAANSIANPELIYPGDVLRIP